MDISKIKVLSGQARVSLVPTPSGDLITVTNDIAITVRPVDIYYGDVKFTTDVETGARILDLTNLDDLTPNEKDLPAGVEVKIMACDLRFPLLPVEFIHPTTGHQYRGVWVKAEDLHYVAGNQGLHLNGTAAVATAEAVDASPEPSSEPIDEVPQAGGFAGEGETPEDLSNHNVDGRV